MHHPLAWIIGGAIVVLAAWLRLYPLVAGRRWRKLDKAPRPPETSKEERRRGLIDGLTFSIGMFVVGGGVGLVTAFVTRDIALAFMLAIVGWVIALVVGMVVVLTIFRDDLFGKKPPHSE